MMGDMIAHQASGVCADRDVYEHHLMCHFANLVDSVAPATGTEPARTEVYATNEELATNEEFATSEELSSSEDFSRQQV